MNSINGDTKKIRWQTRRGIKEVEMLLIPFFEQHYNRLSDIQKEQFQNLLNYPDQDLYTWLLTSIEPPNPDIKQIIDEIRAKR